MKGSYKSSSSCLSVLPTCIVFTRVHFTVLWVNKERMNEWMNTGKVNSPFRPRWACQPTFTIRRYTTRKVSGRLYFSPAGSVAAAERGPEGDVRANKRHNAIHRPPWPANCMLLLDHLELESVSYPGQPPSFSYLPSESPGQASCYLASDIIV